MSIVLTVVGLVILVALSVLGAIAFRSRRSAGRGISPLVKSLEPYDRSRKKDDRWPDGDPSRSASGPMSQQYWLRLADWIIPLELYREGDSNPHGLSPNGF